MIVITNSATEITEMIDTEVTEVADSTTEVVAIICETETTETINHVSIPGKETGTEDVTEVTTITEMTIEGDFAKVTWQEPFEEAGLFS